MTTQDERWSVDVDDLGPIPGEDRPKICATRYEPRDPSTIPPRRWLYDRRLISRFVSLTVSPGGVGKSSLTLVEAMAMVTGQPLLNASPARPLRVWCWNGEDPNEETARRIEAIRLHYQISADDIGGRLFTGSGRKTPIQLAAQDRSGLVIARPIVEELVEAIEADEIDVLIIDPFVTTHSVSENDNGAINAVVALWREIADRTGCAVELVHHTVKLGGARGSSEDHGIAQARGASALVDGVRNARFLAPMSKEDASRA